MNEPHQRTVRTTNPRRLPARYAVFLSDSRTHWIVWERLYDLADGTYAWVVRAHTPTQAAGLDIVRSFYA